MADKGPSSRKVIITTTSNVLLAREAFMRLYQQPGNLAVAQKLMKTKKSLDEIGFGFAEKRDAIAAGLGTPVETGKWKIEADRVEEFQEAVAKITTEEVQISQDVCLTMASLQEFRISAEDLERLTFLILDAE